ncbi:DUF7619 domain-containing protein [Xanthocytophaga flava]|uniref:DUF7619 domain-containing protein n=1 Tax=Xanthocytophaga flava TaxID=3048013 RepID=UPI0028D7781C|nr:SMP-30/gluconolactonase/LRE family protein [Xanthocytophaga flavus]MDJ1472050.1 SMP-30/gluconolactonase/LRE family protein [Xanthocytophaga flavus]
MNKQLPFLFFFLLHISTVYTFGQTYSFKRSLGPPLLLNPSCVATDQQGMLYVADIDGYNGQIMKLDSNGIILEQLVYSDYINSSKPLDRPNGLSIDPQGNIWLSDGQIRIQKFDAKGKSLVKINPYGTRLGSADGQFNTLLDIFADSQGNVWAADANNTRIQKFSTNGNFLAKFGTPGSAEGKFNYPSDVCIDLQGNIWVADKSNYRIQKFDKNGKFLLASGIAGPFDGAFHSPKNLVVDKDNNVWVTDTELCRIQKFDSNGKFLLKFGSQSTITGPVNGTFKNIKDIASDIKGNIWIADVSAKSIQKFDKNGKFILNFGGALGANTVDGQFSSPTGIVIDNQGNTWVGDGGSQHIQKFEANGKFAFRFGSIGDGDGKFRGLHGIVLDSHGNYWITDQVNSYIQRFDDKGNFLERIATVGSADGLVKEPMGMVLDRQGNVWIADSGNQRIQKFDRNGKFLLKFGTSGSANGAFSGPTGIAVDLQGNIWVTDNGNHRIQKFDRNGKFLLTIGSNGTANGQFKNPQGIACDKAGNIWVTDTYNYRIQQFDKNGKFLTKISTLNLQPRYIAFAPNGDLYCTTNRGVYIYSTGIYDPLPTLIKGRIYSDVNQNCTFDNIDKPLSNIFVKTQPGNYYASTDNDGYYEIIADTGTYTVSQVISNTTSALIKPICPANNVSPLISLKNIGDSAVNIDFANQATLFPNLTSSVSSDRRRRCRTNTTVISYANIGYADAQNVKVYVKMPTHIILKSANQPYDIGLDSTYIFSLDTLKSNQSGTIQIIDSVACIADIVGLTACTKTWITPANTHIIPADSYWDSSVITITGKCTENGIIRMVVKNTGQGNMADSTELRLFTDANLALYKKCKLEVGDSLVLRVPANGKTIRLEADQRPGNPLKSQTNLTIEGCIASSNEIISKGYVDLLPQDDSEPEVAVQCLTIRDSYDPNDKQVSPAGTTSEHYTPTSAELKYTIRFQNTGTDTAYVVTVIDTLSEFLDVSTLQNGSISHPYTLNVRGKDQPILIWTFNNINLPDSTHDQDGSNGFIQFSIKPKKDLPEKTLIENFADIVFDYNDPVRTNTTVNVLYDVPSTVKGENKLDAESIMFLRPTISNFTPDNAQAGDQITINGTNYKKIPTDNQVKIGGIQATIISATENQLIVTVPQNVFTGKVSVTTLGGTATSEVDFILKPTATEQPIWSSQIVVSPNPTDGKLTIDFSNTNVSLQQIEIYNHLGKKIVSENISRSTSLKQLDLSAYSAGIYLLIFRTKQENACQKIILK